MFHNESVGVTAVYLLQRVRQKIKTENKVLLENNTNYDGPITRKVVRNVYLKRQIDTDSAILAAGLPTMENSDTKLMRMRLKLGAVECSGEGLFDVKIWGNWKILHRFLYIWV